MSGVRIASIWSYWTGRALYTPTRATARSCGLDASDRPDVCTRTPARGGCAYGRRAYIADPRDIGARPHGVVPKESDQSRSPEGPSSSPRNPPFIVEIGLVSCTKSKRAEPAAPGELYDTSTLFNKSSQYAKSHHDRWLILSAKHHVLDPDGPPIDPYDETLTDFGVEKRRTWAARVHDQLDQRRLIREDVELVFHAGKAYYGELLPLLDDTPVSVSIPTEGLQIGQTLAWYNEHQ